MDCTPQRGEKQVAVRWRPVAENRDSTALEPGNKSAGPVYATEDPPDGSVGAWLGLQETALPPAPGTG